MNSKNRKNRSLYTGLYAIKVGVMVLLLGGVAQPSLGCVGDYAPDAEYCNVFSQELIKDPRYAPFLLSYDHPFYESANPRWKARNANIEQWQKYLGLNYDQAHYLVMKATRADIQALTKGSQTTDPKLTFFTPDFVQRHKQALLYLAYAKYLEPYMHIIRQTESWNYYSEYSDLKEVSELDEQKVTNVLIRSWNAETDKELKLRYGYQLVRFAHYNRKYNDAVTLFDKYVKTLDYKPEMYYYALSQKAGALYGLGRTQEAISDFIKVFTYSADLKKSAYASVFLIHNNDYNERPQADWNTERLLSSVQTDAERRSLYFMLGYKAFNNPLNELEKIVASDPDAIEAKVLMVRAINAIERDVLADRYSYSLKAADKRYPLLTEKEITNFLGASYKLSAKMIRLARKKDFWNLTTAYLCFLRKDFAQARNHLAQITTADATYARQKDIIAAHLYIAEQTQISPETERTLHAQYAQMLDRNNLSNRTFLQILANRYYLQKEYAKAFLISNTLASVRRNLQKPLLDELAAFHNKKNKNELETWLDKNLRDDSFNLLYGTFFLTEGNLEAAHRYFQAEKKARIHVSARIFGYNIREWYSGAEKDVMRDDYLADFPFIKQRMSEKDVTDALLKLRKAGEKNDAEAAKANFLLGNFFYNVTTTGYFRHYLRFDTDNSYFSEKYSDYNEERAKDNYMANPEQTFYVIYGDSYYRNTTDLAGKYLQKALKQVKDDELKARILFALAKNELERSYKGQDYFTGVDDLPAETVNYFNQLTQYKETAFYKDACTYCKYFDDYVSR